MRTILRIFVGLIFIASGFVKAVDPVGFSFKLEEYFGAGVFNLPFLEPFVLPIAVFVSCAEVLLGLFLLLKFRLKFTLSALIALCIFLAFLTFYSAYFNVVTDCGCFGDAVKFTPWHSFFKDIFLLFLLLILWFLYQKDFNLIKSQKRNFPLIFISVLVLGIFVFYGIFHEPLIDFRDYKIGTDLNLEKKKIAENPSEFKTFYVVKNTATGEEKKLSQDDYINDENYWKVGSQWEILKDKTSSEISRKGYNSEVSKFRINDDSGNEITERILHAPKAILLFSYNPSAIDPDFLKQIEGKLNSEKNTKIFAVSTSRKLLENFPNATMDGTAIKTIARSNPFVLTLQNGKIMDKRSAKDYLKN